MPFTDPGECEAMKGAFHGGLLVWSAVCGVYNVAAWLTRRERHLAMNSGIYAAVVAWEIWQVVKHDRAGRRCANRIGRVA